MHEVHLTLSAHDHNHHHAVLALAPAPAPAPALVLVSALTQRDRCQRVEALFQLHLVAFQCHHQHL